MIALTLDWKVFLLIMVIILWMMNNTKIKVIFGEIRKILQILPISKIAQAIIAYSKSNGKSKPDPEP
jgi:hypothetical protein